MKLSLNIDPLPILFEAHWFSRFTDGRYDDFHPDISGPEWASSLPSVGWPSAVPSVKKSKTTKKAGSIFHVRRVTTKPLAYEEGRLFTQKAETTELKVTASPKVVKAFYARTGPGVQ